MENIIWYEFLVACFAIAFCFVWGVLVFGLTREHGDVETENKDFSSTPVGLKRSKFCVGVLIGAMVYLVVTGAFDAVFYGTLTLSFVLGASACWSFGNALGTSIFAPDAWRMQRTKTYGQALILVMAVVVVQQLMDYI